ncbi:CHRD domain-containing protein [bacterium]|nr:CHRD domain-containing protein [bacterium]
MLKTLALSAALALGLGGAAMADMVKWSAKLDQAQEGDFKTKVAGAMGDASGTLDTATGAMTWDVSWMGLSGDATAMHFHGPAPAGKNAGVLVDIGKASGLKSPSKGSAKLTPDQVKQVMDGMWYVNIHTAANPKGEIRGQVKTGM